MNLVKKDGKRKLLFPNLSSKHFVSTVDHGCIKEGLANRLPGTVHDLKSIFGHEQTYFIRARHGWDVKIVEPHTSEIHTDFELDGLGYTIDTPIKGSRKNSPIFEKRSGIIGCTTGDCPILLIEAIKNGRKHVSIIHSGWKGTFYNIAGRAIHKIVFEGFRHSEISIGLWSGICQECYEVGDDLRDALIFYRHHFQIGKDENHWQLNVANIIRQQLNEVGIKNSQISQSSYCPRCYQQKGKPLFYSHRRGELTRNGLFIMA